MFLIQEPEVILTKEHEEWTTCKRVINHKTKQVETRIQRQLILEDGRVVADSGPQVTTKTTEDVRVEETENTERKTTGGNPSRPGYSLVPGSVTVISEKKESNQVVTESKQEQKQLHDERFQDVEELLQTTMILPNDSNFSSTLDSSSEYPGTLVHFSCRSQKITDKEEVKEVTEEVNGEQSTETIRTHHHEEAYDDEVPEDEAEVIPEKSSDTSRIIQFYTDQAEFDALSEKLQRESLQNREKIKSAAVCNQKWQGNSFGAEQGIATTKTISGGNKIIIEMSGSKCSPSDSSHSTSSTAGVHYQPFNERNSQKKQTRSSSGVSPFTASEAIPNPRKNIEGKYSQLVELTSGSNPRHKNPYVKSLFAEENGTRKKENRKLNCTSNVDDISKGSSSTEILASDRWRKNAYKSALGNKRISDQGYVVKHDIGHTLTLGSNKQPNKSDKEIQVSMSDDNSSDGGDFPSYRGEQSSFLYDVPERQKSITSSWHSNFPSSRYFGHSSSSDLHHSKDYDYYASKFQSNASPSNFTISARSKEFEEAPLHQMLLGSDMPTEIHSGYSKPMGKRLRNDCSASSQISSIKTEKDKYIHNNVLFKRKTNDHEAPVTEDSYNQRTLSGKAKSFIFSRKQHPKKKNLPMYHSSSTPQSSTSSPCLINEKYSDSCDSSSSLSSNEYPTRDIRPRQKFSSNLRSNRSSSNVLSSKALNSPSSFTPLNNNALTANGKRDRQKYVRAKSGKDAKVKVRQWYEN